MQSDNKVGFIGGMLQGRFLGHPIHVMLVHFPTAFYLLADILQAVVYFTHEQILLTVAYYVLFCGLVSAAPTVLYGAWDILKISPVSKALKIAFLHAGAQLIVSCFFLFALLIMAKQKPHFQEPSTLTLVLYILAGLLLLVGNYLGGELLMRYRVGIPESYRRED